MDGEQFSALWDQMRQKYGVYLRVLDRIPADRFHGHPVPGMRTPAEMVAHISGSIVRDITKGILSGTIEADEAGEDEVAAGLEEKAAVLAFARDCWKEADAAAGSIGEEELGRTVGNPWGMTLPAPVAVHILNDEFVHHRGQLYAYVRACGEEPPFIWGFEENEEAFAPHG